MENKMENLIERVTIVGVNGQNVKYSGSQHFSGCDISNFSEVPMVNDVWEIITNWGKTVSTTLISR
jgi:hypothetical protein